MRQVHLLMTILRRRATSLYAQISLGLCFRDMATHLVAMFRLWCFSVEFLTENIRRRSGQSQNEGTKEPHTAMAGMQNLYLHAGLDTTTIKKGKG